MTNNDEKPSHILFGLEIHKAIGENREQVLKTLREADGLRFHDYIGGYEQATWNIQKLIAKMLQEQYPAVGTHKQMLNAPGPIAETPPT